MVNVQTEILIQRPREVVATYTSDPDNAPAWYVNIRSAQWQTPRPLVVGSLVAFTARFLDRNLDYIYEFTELVPGEKLTMRTSQGPFPMQTTYSWSDENGATRMTLHNTGEPSGFSTLAGIIMAPMMRMAMRKDLENLKRILEAT
ncbi:SRPBCC family protein [Arthrobacter sp. B2a2-09]|uniref:SRPBCC family protein n=1 Tax=Arthrobacter sp. B2a2-09 TaxID=2952822 RepID=UPI0022CDA0F7|nr:SRPBCC family protein [Arthrobacter sp. B2a2-09]MCZ9881875.1 SRPBCC family protein [Arthrobacter sp. B2a2-09]